MITLLLNKYTYFIIYLMIIMPYLSHCTQVESSPWTYAKS